MVFGLLMEWEGFMGGELGSGWLRAGVGEGGRETLSVSLVSLVLEGSRSQFRN